MLATKLFTVYILTGNLSYPGSTTPCSTATSELQTTPYTMHGRRGLYYYLVECTSVYTELYFHELQIYPGKLKTAIINRLQSKLSQVKTKLHHSHKHTQVYINATNLVLSQSEDFLWEIQKYRRYSQSVPVQRERGYPL